MSRAPSSAPAASSASVPSAASSAASSSNNGISLPANVKLPAETTLLHAAKLSLSQDKPIMFDYWLPSIDGQAVIGLRDNKDKLLVKSEEEYTSTILKFYKTGEEYIIITENSIYLVVATISIRKIT